VRRRFHRLPSEVRAEIVRRAKAGQSQRQIVREVDVSSGAVRSVLRPIGGVHRGSSWPPSGARLSLDDRVEIAAGVRASESLRSIGRRVGRDHSTISREVNANGGRERYRPQAAHARAQAMARRPKPTKLVSNPRLRARVEAGLKRLWSPEEIAGQLRDEFGNDPSMTVSHETIYKSLYVQGRGELRRELAACLRTGRAARRPQGRLETPGRIPNMVLISERPGEVEDRAVPGHWEGDLIIGKNGRSQVGTLVERSTGYVLLLHLPNGRTAEEVRDAMTRKIATLPATLVRSITWDQGKEMSSHAAFTVATGVPIYFCDPHKPWQRGSNENTNGLLRQYLPKGTDLSVHTEADLDEIARSLNTRPRKRFAWKTPGYQLDQFIGVMTA
jgi:transposase, IS30 family